MPNYRTHTYFNFFLSLPLLLGGILYFLHPPFVYLITFTACFSYATLFMNPDLDLVHMINLFSLRGLFALPFRLYSKVFRHRGLSHSFLFGSLTRIAWLSIFGLVLFFLIYKALPAEKDFLLFYQKNKWHLIYGFAGITLADWSHLILDKI